MQYTVVRVDPHTNSIVDWATVDADDRNDAIRQRPEGWTRRETRPYKGLVRYLNA